MHRLSYRVFEVAKGGLLVFGDPDIATEASRRMKKRSSG